MDPNLSDTTIDPQTASSATDPLDIATLPVGPVIEQLGGERELARKLDLSASTVQGWKLRDHIPEAYHHRLKNLLQEIDAEPAPEPASAPRAASPQTVPNPTRANPNAAYYAMPQSTVRYWVMSSLTSLGLLALVTLILLILFFGRDFFDLVSGDHHSADNSPVAADYPANMQPAMPPVDQSRATLDETLNSVQQIKQDVAPDQAAQIGRIENVIAGLRDRVDGLDKTLQEKGIDTGAIRREISDLSRRDVMAAALLLGVAQIHGMLDAQANFAQDLAFLKALSANDAAMTQSLDKLAPFAEHGLMTREQMLDTLNMVGTETVKINRTRPDLGWSQKLWAAVNNVIEIRRKAPEPTMTANGRQYDISTPQGQVAQARSYIENDDFALAAQLLQSYQGPGLEQIAQVTRNLQGREAAMTVLDTLLQKSQGLLNIDQLKALMAPAAPSATATTEPAEAAVPTETAPVETAPADVD